MTIDYSYIVAPFVDGIIGYVTINIAIRMLFRPHKAKYLLGLKIPFTPGIIPKEKGRIASKLGMFISDNFMKKDVLKKTLLSEDIISKLQRTIDGFFHKQSQNTETLKVFVLHFISKEEVNAIVSDMRSNISKQVSNKLGETKIGEQIAEVVINHVLSKLRVDGLDIDVPQMFMSILGGSIWGKMAELIEIPAKNYMAKNINQILTDNGPEIIENLVSNKINDLLDLPMQQLLAGKEKQISKITSSCIAIYRTAITDHLPRILETINIPFFLETRINEMDMDETERLIFHVMDKELKAIVWFGALFGFLMGFINLLF